MCIQMADVELKRTYAKPQTLVNFTFALYKEICMLLKIWGFLIVWSSNLDLDDED